MEYSQQTKQPLLPVLCSYTQEERLPVGLAEVTFSVGVSMCVCVCVGGGLGWNCHAQMHVT